MKHTIGHAHRKYIIFQMEVGVCTVENPFHVHYSSIRPTVKPSKVISRAGKTLRNLLHEQAKFKTKQKTLTGSKV